MTPTFSTPTRLLTDTPLPVNLDLTRPVSALPGVATDVVNSNFATNLVMTNPHATRPAPSEPVRPQFPKVEDTFLGFHLLSELGTGAFGRVFLAEQVGLANRLVALKVTMRPTREPQQLAKLRHTNVMPIHSVHDAAPLQAVCMPFLGRHTLADMVKEYRSTGIFPGTAAHSATTQAAARTTVVNPQSDPNLPAPTAPAEDIHTLPTPPALAGETHVEVVLWLMARMAEGLDHAHEAGILHLDLKPANVLVADDGQPLLLDFNLAFDIQAGDRERAGGTLPYMAPEQLDEFHFKSHKTSQLDRRTDLYALGVIFFELLTGRHPFPIAQGERVNPIEMAKVRRAGAPSPRLANSQVSPAVDAIVRTLLQPNPAQRYQTARDLLTDLERHRLNLSLKFAPDRSVVESFRKWRKRNPRAATYAMLVGAVLSVGGLSVKAYQDAEVRAASLATTEAQNVRAELATLRADLTARQGGAVRSERLAHARDVLARYGDATNWTQHPSVRKLSPAARAELGADLGELALLIAHAEWLGGRDTAATERALPWNQAAEQYYAGRDIPAAVAVQRARLTASNDKPAVGTTSTDLFLRGAELIADGRYQLAEVPLRDLVGHDPTHFAGQFALGLCYQEMGARAKAIERYHMATALVPTDPRPSYNRGVSLIFDGRQADAEAAFTEAIKCDPKYGDAYLQRALVRGYQANHSGAVEDLTAALTHGAPPIQVYHLRAEAYGKLKDTAAAKQDLAAAAKLTPNTAMDYNVRGWTLLRTQPKAALADFVKASELDPHSLSAWQNQAHVLADHLDQQVKGLAAQEKAVACYPEFGPARIGRGVLYARLGEREKAHADAQQALVLSPDDALITYQAACVYALTAATHPEDAETAIDLFRTALGKRYRDFATIESDPDVKSIRQSPEFRAALQAAKELARGEAR